LARMSRARSCHGGARDWPHLSTAIPTASVNLRTEHAGVATPHAHMSPIAGSMSFAIAVDRHLREVKRSRRSSGGLARPSRREESSRRASALSMASSRDGYCLAVRVCTGPESLG
jgi:hypothetical protein